MEEYIAKIQNIYKHLIRYVDSVENSNDDYQMLEFFLDQEQITKNKDDLKLLLNLINRITIKLEPKFNNGFSSRSFHTKLEN